MCLQLLYVKHELHSSASPNAPLFNPQFIRKIFSPKPRRQASSFFFLISHVSICRIKSVERDFSLSRNVVKLVCSTFPQFFAAAYLLTFPVLRWEHCQKEVVWQLVSESTSHFAIRGFFSVMPIRTLTIVRHQGRNPFLNLAKEPGGCCRYRNSEL